MTDASRRIGEILEVNLRAGNRVEEVIQVFLEFKSLVDVASIVEESRRTQHVVSFVVFLQSHVELLHKELVTERDERARHIVENNVVEESALVDLVQYLLVRVVSHCHVWVITSRNVESKEVLQREEWLV